MTETIITFCVLLVLGIFIGFVYSLTGDYNKNMIISLSILPILVFSVLSAVNGNMGTSIAVLGVFSLIRFRSLPGTSRDIVFIFYTMAVGILSLVNIIYSVALAISLGIIIILLFKSKFGENKNSYQHLKILIPEDINYNDLFSDVFTEYLDDYDLERVKLTNMGSMYELTYKIKQKKNINEKEFIDTLRIRNGNLTIILNKVLNNEGL